MKRVVLGFLAIGLSAGLSACAPQPLTDAVVLKKLEEAKIACVDPERVGSVTCHDAGGTPYNIIIYAGGQSQMDQDLKGMCESEGDKYSDWAEGVNWRAYSTDLVPSEDLASALGGSLKTKAKDCN
jgi:hypothetical protein